MMHCHAALSMRALADLGLHAIYYADASTAETLAHKLVQLHSESQNERSTEQHETENSARKPYLILSGNL